MIVLISVAVVGKQAEMLLLANEGEGAARLIEMHSEVVKAVEIRVLLSSSMLNAGLFVLAGLWGLAFSEKLQNRQVLNGVPETALLVIATLSIVLSVYSHYRYVWDQTSNLSHAHSELPETQTVADSSSDASRSVGDRGAKTRYVADPDNDVVARYFYIQLLSLTAGAVIGASAIFSGRYLA